METINCAIYSVYLYNKQNYSTSKDICKIL